MTPEPKYKPGNRAIFTNPYGVCFGVATIIKAVRASDFFGYSTSLHRIMTYPDHWRYFWDQSLRAVGLCFPEGNASASKTPKFE